MTEQNKTPLTAQPGSAPAPEQKPAEKRPAEKPLRRVGSLTLGACLIAAGVFFLLYFFVPGFDMQLTLKIAPAVALVLLGCEVLFFAARPGRWKYDFMSVFVCLVLMAGCFGLSFVPVVLDEFGPARTQTAAKLGQEYSNAVYEAFRKDAPDISLRDVYAEVYLYTNTAETLDALQPGNGRLTLYVELFGPCASTEDFAAACRRLTDSIRKQGVQPDTVSFVCNAALPDNEVRSSLDSGSLQQPKDYRLELEGTAQLDWTAEQMARETSVTSLLDEENEPEEDASSVEESSAAAAA